jgi:hypothetical protein
MSTAALGLLVTFVSGGAWALEQPGKGGITIVDGLPGWWQAGSNPTAYVVTIDRQITHGGRASARLASRVPTATGFGSLMQVAAVDRYRGKRIRLSAWVKSDAMVRYAGLWLRIDAPDQEPTHALASDAMQSRPISGTRDWRRYEIVLDVAPTAADIAFGAHLSGSGTIWVDDFQIEIVDASVPVTNHSRPRNLDFERYLKEQ